MYSICLRLVLAKRRISISTIKKVLIAQHLFCFLHTKLYKKKLIDKCYAYTY